ncbi:hypothetical protein DFP72DRAFT_1105837 [Ephemerocybe angulata]|uniref:Uncharacterized protein n=1 Tax=Ephemerocybe angulata TaxID=980116 RepID=A0A8H6HAD2_9AGAR|nr:hypothetical protein DFP72DRAFT_1105837 [Tulosesus angulatus]
MTTTMRDIEDGVKMMTRAQTTMTARTRWDDDEPYDYGEWAGISFATGQTSIALENSRSPDEFLLRLRHLSPIRHVTTTGTLECPVGHANHPSLAGRISIVTSEGQRLRHSSHVTQVTANVKIPTLKTAQGSANYPLLAGRISVAASSSRRHHPDSPPRPYATPEAPSKSQARPLPTHRSLRFRESVRGNSFYRDFAKSGKCTSQFMGDFGLRTELGMLVMTGTFAWTHDIFAHHSLIGFNGISPVCHSPEKFLAIALTSYLSPSHAPREPRPELGRNYAAAQVAARETQYSVSIDPHGHLALLAPTRSLVHYSMTLFDSLPRDLDRAHSAFKDGTRLISRRDLLSVRPLSKLSSHGLHDDTATTLA